MGKQIDIAAPNLGPLTADEMAVLLKALVNEMTAEQVADALIEATTEHDRDDIVDLLRVSLEGGCADG